MARPRWGYGPVRRGAELVAGSEDLERGSADQLAMVTRALGSPVRSFGATQHRQQQRGEQNPRANLVPR